jgi:hypothetical protein
MPREPTMKTLALPLSPDADLIAISNWTGHEQMIVVKLDNASAYREIASVTGKIV